MSRHSISNHFGLQHSLRIESRPQPARPLPADPEQPEVVESRWGRAWVFAFAGACWGVFGLFLVALGCL